MSVNILTLRAGIQTPAELFVSCAEFAGLSLDLLRPSSVSCNSYRQDVGVNCKGTDTKGPWSRLRFAFFATAEVFIRPRKPQNYLEMNIK